MKIAFLGGSFNPPHSAHIAICEYIIEKDLSEKVLMVPCFQHPFGKNLAPFEQRYTMCKLSTAQFGDRVVVSDIERQLGKVSTTLNTIKALIKEFPENSYHLVIGTDILEEKDKWSGFDSLLSLAPPIIIQRAGHSNDKEIEFSIQNACLPDISSTKVRDIVSKKENMRNIVHPEVKKFILSHKLYV